MRKVLSLDLGSSTFKLILGELDGGKLMVTQARLLSLPGAVDPAAKKAALGELLKGISLSNTLCVSVIDDPFAVVTQVAIPQMPVSEMAGAVKWELQRLITLPPEETAVDCELLQGAQEGGKRKLLAVAFPTSQIREHLAFLTQAAVEPSRLIPKAVAVAQWVDQSFAPNETAAVVLLGKGSSDFLVVRGGRPLFTRRIPVAGQDFTKGLTAVLMTPQGQVGFTEPEAETVKRTIGIPSPDSSQVVAKGISGVQLLALLRGNLERLAVEVERSAAFYGETTGEQLPGTLLLIGGGAHLKGLSPWLSERLKMEVQLPDPWKGIVVSPTALSGEAASIPLSFIPAIGAALAPKEGLNLLPQEMKAAAAAKMQKAVAVGLVTAFLAAAVLARVGLAVSEKVLSMKNAAYQLEREVYRAEVSQAKVAQAAKAKSLGEPLWAELFKELSQIIPREIYLSQLSIQGRQVSLRGRVRDLGKQPDLALTDFMRELSMGLLNEVQLSSSRQVEGPTKETEFEMKASLR